MRTNRAEELPLNLAGSSVFGRYPKIDIEKTFNMFISDEWMVNYPGFKKVVEVSGSGEGRGFFHSARGRLNIVVINSGVYKFENNAAFFIGNLETSRGEVSIDENLNRQICIVDGRKAYIYNYDVGSFTTQSLSFIPGYVCYHNTFFLLASVITDTNPQKWYAATYVDPNTITVLSTNEFSIQTKPDSSLAVKRLPGRANHVIVFGSIVAEVWAQVGGLENYRRVSSFNIDMGAVSVSTIAANEQFVCWLSQNESNSPAIMVTDGSSFNRLSTDGIDYLLQSLKRPDQSTAFFYRIDGHLFYQLTFFNSQDNLSLIYDFNTQKFFNVCDEKQNYHPARQVIYSDEATYFCSLNDGSIYQTGTDFVTYDYTIGTELNTGKIIPRIRICRTIRREDSAPYRIGRFSFWMEQGVTDYVIPRPGYECSGLLVTELEEDFIVTEDGIPIQTQNGTCDINAGRPAIDLRFSKNGNMSFSNIVRQYLNPQGHYRNRVTFNRLGMANEFTLQVSFIGMNRFIVNSGIIEIY